MTCLLIIVIEKYIVNVFGLTDFFVGPNGRRSLTLLRRVDRGGPKFHFAHVIDIALTTSGVCLISYFRP